MHGSGTHHMDDDNREIGMRMRGVRYLVNVDLLRFVDPLGMVQ